MDIQACLFWIIACLTGLSAIAVVVSQNIVRSATWLLFTLAGVAAIYFLIGADFVGATQLIVYVGGILVLVVFGVMLTAQGPFISMKVGAAEWAIALGVGLLFFGLLAVCVVRTAWPETWFTITDLYIQELEDRDIPKHIRERLNLMKEKSFATEAQFRDALENGLQPDDYHRYHETLVAVANAEQTVSSTTLGEAFLGIKEATPKANLTGWPNAPARERRAYLLPFEIVSVHLLVVLIGAAYLARAKRRKGTVA
jgi:NADH-quinone oxidoreductase subunit J